jgi:hypothetical protein
MSNKNVNHATEELWKNEPATLTEIQRNDPIKAIRFIASWGPLFRMRFRLKDMLIAAMYSPHWKDETPEQKGDQL